MALSGHVELKNAIFLKARSFFLTILVSARCLGIEVLMKKLYK